MKSAVGWSAVALVTTVATGCVEEPPIVRLDAEATSIISRSDAEVGLYYRDLDSGDTLVINGDLRMHAASTMKVPVMIQLFRDAATGRISLDDSVVVRNSFRSIVDGSEYSLDLSEDSDSTVYGRVGRRVAVIELLEPMITRSSNLATNILIELVGPERTTATMRTLGADSIEVLRGVEDLEAYRAGLSNTTTARDLGAIFSALAEGAAAGPEASARMIEILEAQEFNDGIPAGVPTGARVAHKTGNITEINHDAGIVELEDGSRYVIVVLTRGIEELSAGEALIAELSRAVYREMYAD